jgi:hypothetical protein
MHDKKSTDKLEVYSWDRGLGIPDRVLKGSEKAAETP